MAMCANAKTWRWRGQWAFGQFWMKRGLIKKERGERKPKELDLFQLAGVDNKDEQGKDKEKRVKLEAGKEEDHMHLRAQCANDSS